MPLCEPFPTDGGPANPLQSSYFTNYWSVFLENEYFQMQRHKAEVLGLLGDWAMRKMKSRLKEDENADGFRIIVKVGPPWPAVATAPSLPIIQRDWIWLESLLVDMKASLPPPRTVSNKQLVDAIISYLKTRWEDQLSSDSDEEQDIPSYLRKREKERRNSIESKPLGISNLRFDLTSSFPSDVMEKRLISSMPTFSSASAPAPKISSVSIPQPVTQNSSAPIMIATSTSPGAGIGSASGSSSGSGSGIKPSTGMPVLSGIAVSSARVPWNSPGNTPPSNPPSPLSSSPPLPSSYYLSNPSPSSSSSSRSSSPSSSSFNSGTSPISGAPLRGIGTGSGSLSRVHSVSSIGDKMGEMTSGIELAAAAMDLEMDPLFSSPEPFAIAERVSRLPSPPSSSSSLTTQKQASQSSYQQHQQHMQQQQQLQLQRQLQETAREEKAKEKQATARVIHFL
eukprot:TRINITY_DN11573_c0_g1_i1.p1 TRINITY_DN11573_c0_g1~~TRINITY_DN11573_c0_g1_i1.p1  ORF type:complete len:452 (-),score=87.46 TRINITY_DN11573_c0_g1_i1:37-1392(-)